MNVDIDLDFICDVCKSGLGVSHVKNTVRVDLCGKCVSYAEEAAEARGYDKGYANAETEFKDNIRASLRATSEALEASGITFPSCEESKAGGAPIVSSSL